MMYKLFKTAAVAVHTFKGRKVVANQKIELNQQQFIKKLYEQFFLRERGSHFGHSFFIDDTWHTF